MKWERKFGQVAAVCAVLAFTGFLWMIFVGATLWALAELGAIDRVYSIERLWATTFLYWSAFALLTASNNTGAWIQKRLRSEDLPLTQLRNALIEREAKMAEADEARH